MSANSKTYDVLIVGGGPAGLAVATAIVRQLHTAILFDSGVYRNARTEHMHGVPGFDHADPKVFRTKTKTDILSRYDTVEFRKAYVEQIKKLDNGNFQATDGHGNVYEGKKVVLAAGVKDIMPEIQGYKDCWGWGIYHSLFCSGYEERGGDSAGVLAVGMLNNAELLSRVGNMAVQLAKKITIYTNGDEGIASSIRDHVQIADFKTRVAIEKRKINSLKTVSQEASGVLVTLEDGTEIKESFITHEPEFELNGPFVSQLGLETGPQGEIKVSQPFNETSVHGVFAAGDAASMFKVVPAAIFGGSMAAAGLVYQLQAERARTEQLEPHT